jgi:hypothetical protein
MIGRNRTIPPAVQAAALRKAFPAYSVFVNTRGDGPRFELVTKDDSNPWCLISSDISEIWRELKGQCLTCQT